MKSESPGKKIWKRFRKNRLSLLGLIIILSAIFISFFCYLFIPDRTPDANRMSIALGNLPPGTSIRFIKLRLQSSVDSPSFFDSIFLGVKDKYQYVPVQSLRFEQEFIVYSEYAGPGTPGLPEQKINLAKALYFLKEGSSQDLDADRLSFVSFNGKNESFDIEYLRNEFNSKQVLDQKFFLGTDRFGRDLLSRLLAGTRVTFGVGLIAVLISLFVGTFLGSVAGFFRGKVDQAVLWLINVVWSIPTLLLVIAITLVLGKGFEQVFIAVGLTMWVDVARIVRSQLFSIRELEYIAAGKSLGFTAPRIVIRHMLPNIMGPVLVVAAANFSTAILLEAGLSFLGIGAQPPTPSWGAMIKENYGYIIMPESAHLAIFPGLAIMLLTMAFTFVANGLRDAIDSREQFSISG